MDDLKKVMKDAIEANHIEEVMKSIHEAVGHGHSNVTSKDEVQALLNECLYNIMLCVLVATRLQKN